jgi:hypothetical protein
LGKGVKQASPLVKRRGGGPEGGGGRKRRLAGCGQYYQHSDVGNFIVEKYSDITAKIIPFFEKYPVKGVKALDFAD